MGGLLGHIRPATVVSAAAHVLLVLVAQYGLPHLFTQPPVAARVIPVDVVNIGDITRPPEAATPEPSPEPEPVAAATPQPPPAPPQPVPEPPRAEPPPPEPPASRPVVPPTPPQAEPRPEPPQAEPEPPRSELAEARPVARPTPPAPSRDFDSVLKDLAATTPAPRAEQRAPKPATPSEEGREAPQQANVSDQPTIAELDRLRQLIRERVRPCWNPPIGVAEARELVVTLRIGVDQQGYVRDVEVVDSTRMAFEPRFQAAADAARRAVLNPRCQPLELPLDRYDVWKEIRFVFDPRDMLG